jgi:hypothetical protein
MYYILVGHTPMAVDMWTWAEDVERRSRSIRDGNGDPWRVGRTELTDAATSARCSWAPDELGGLGVLATRIGSAKAGPVHAVDFE